MYVGDQNYGVTQLELEFLARHGVKNIDANHGAALDPTPPHGDPARHHPAPTTALMPLVPAVAQACPRR